MSDVNNAQAEAPAVELDTPEVAAPEVKDAVVPEGEAPAEKEGEEGETDAEGQPRKRSGVQRLKARNTFLQTELADRERRLEEFERQTRAVDPGDKEPSENDYPNDYFAFERAKTAYEVRKVIREENRKSQEGSIKNERQNIMRERSMAHLERVESAKETITDFDQVVKSASGISITTEVGEEILSSEKSELLTYYLAKNPDKLRALNSMTGRELAKEIGRLEGSVRMPAARKQTAALAPLTPLKGGAAGSFDPVSASMEDYAAKRKAGWRG